MRDPYYRSKI